MAAAPSSIPPPLSHPDPQVFEELRTAMAEWVGKERRPLELAAAKKDALALLESYPLPPMALATRGDGEAESLMALGRGLL
jgi:hypothetical protein